MPELTSPQVLVNVEFDGELLPHDIPSTLTFQKMRKIQRDPTVSFLRRLVIAPAFAAKWSVEVDDGVDEEIGDEILAEYMPMRSHLLRTGLLYTMEYGWHGFEKVWQLDEDRWFLKKLKPLLHDYTSILVDTKTGSFKGLRNEPLGVGEPVDLKLEKSLLLSHMVEGTDWYGNGIFAVLESTFDNYNTVNETANRFDRKISGAHWVIHYPVGTSEINGEEVDNSIIANDLLKALISSGGFIVPRRLDATLAELNEGSADAWKIELIAAQGSISSHFTDRLKYLDALKARAYGVAERAVFEGQYGTKAEASAHADFTITIRELEHSELLQVLNKHCVNQSLRLNWGREFEDKVRLIALPIVDRVREWLKELYMAVLSTPEGQLDQLDQIDGDALRDMLGIPSKEEEF